jgi:hypothetical protein
MYGWQKQILYRKFYFLSAALAVGHLVQISAHNVEFFGARIFTEQRSIRCMFTQPFSILPLQNE